MMEIKKSREADLESYRPTWLLVGYVVALAVLFIAFEWSEPEETPDMKELLSELVFEEELEVPIIERPTTPPPLPPPALPAVKETIDVVENDEKIEETEPESSEQIGSEPSLQEELPPAGNELTATEEPVFVVVDQLPEFPMDGQRGLMRYLTQHIRYPQIAWKQHIQGNVLCQFIVNADGSITDVQVLQGVHPLLDKEAVRVLNNMPRWKPGMLKGQPVRVRFTLPIVFRLQ